MNYESKLTNREKELADDLRNIVKRKRKTNNTKVYKAYEKLCKIIIYEMHNNVGGN